VLQAHTHQWVGTYTGAGNRDYRGELRQAVKAICGYAKAQSLLLSQAVVRLDGQYGNGAIVADLAGLSYVMRGKEYDLLDRPEVQVRLTQPPDQQRAISKRGCVEPSLISLISLFRPSGRDHPHIWGTDELRRKSPDGVLALEAILS